MATNSIALRPRVRELRRICSRCRAPYQEGHICPDWVRHPGVERFFSALHALANRPNPEHTREALASWMQETPTGPDLSLFAGDPRDLDLAVEAFGVAMIWVNLPPSEQRVANAILQHAGYPLLDAA